MSSETIADSELRDLLWSITMDALVAVALPLPAARAPMVGVRFWPRKSHLIGYDLRLDLASVWAAARQKAELLAQGQASAGGHPLLTSPQLPWAVVCSEQWTLSWQIDGRATIKDLAWQNGFALCDTMEWVEGLIRAGLCVIAANADHPGAAGPAPIDAARKRPRMRDGGPARHGARPGEPAPPLHEEEPPEPAGDAPSGAGSLSGPAESAALELPHRSPGASLGTRSARTRPPVPQWRAEDIQKAPETSHSDLLRRILKGLRRID